MSKRIPTECVSWRWHGNLGDEMIWAAQEAMFADSLDLGQYLPAAEAVMVGGGTFVPKFPEHPELVELSHRLPTVIFGTGIGDSLFWGTDHIPAWLEIVRNARFVGVRGPLSKERLESWGVSSDRIEWVGDSALYFADAEPRSHHSRGKLAVNLGWAYDLLYGFNEQQLEETVIAALRQLVQAGWDITLVCAWEPDDAVIDRIRAKVSVSSVEHWHDDYARALESVKQFDLVLCEKLHIGVVAACRTVPFIALNYRSKVMDFCRSIGWEKYCVNIENLTPEQLMEHVTTLAQAQDEHTNLLHRGVLKARERLLQAVPRAVSALVMQPKD